MLQVLRDRREREALQRPHETHHSRPLSVPPRSHVAYGSHPDLTGHEYSVYNNTLPPEMPSYMPYQSGHKMYSSLSKIQSISPEKTAVKKIKIRRRPDSQKIMVNSNYMRPLTPHLPFGGARRDSFEQSDSSKAKSAKWNVRHRPASSMDVMASPERRDRVIEHWRQQSSLDSPRGHPGEGRARNDLHISVQKLLAERDRPSEHEHQEVKVVPSEYSRDYDMNVRTFQPVPVNDGLPDNENVDDYDVDGDVDNGHSSFDEGLQQSQDYGIFGDDDNDESYKYESQTPRRRILPEPIIKGNLNKPRTDTNQNQRVLPYVVPDSENSQALSSQTFSQEQIAVSLAHSLSDNPIHISKVENESLSSSDKSDSSSRKRKDNEIAKSCEELRYKEIDLRLKPENLVPLNNDEVFETKSVSKVESDGIQRESEIERSNFENNKTYVQAEKPSEDEIQNIIKQNQTSPRWANIENNDISENDVEVEEEKQPQVVKRRPLSLKVRQQEMGDNSTSKLSNIPSPTGNKYRNSAVEPTQRQTTPSKTRLSQPNLDQMYSSRIPVRPLSPSSPSEGKNVNGATKDTKIPVYSPRKKDKGSKTPRESTLSKSTEEISKMKKKTPFKDSIKNFFGRKR